MEYINDDLIRKVSADSHIKETQIRAVLGLLEEGNTVPFIARYRKEITGSLDEEQIREIEKEYEYGVSLQKRKEDITRLIDEKGMLTEELKTKIAEAMKLVDLEDLYRPFKEKKKTKATEAIAKGLEPLAKTILTFPKIDRLDDLVTPYLNDAVSSVKDAFEGAKYIIAETISDNAAYRKWIRDFSNRTGKIVTKKKKDAVDELATYQNYYEYEEALKTVKLHRILAMNRAENEKVISVDLAVEKAEIQAFLEKQVIGNHDSLVNPLVKEAIADSYKRLISGAIEREIRSDFTERAEDSAIRLFSENLRSLLLQPPMKGKMVLGVDPAFRTGCKIAVIDSFGKFIDKTVIFPHETKLGGVADARKVEEARIKVKTLIEKNHIDIIAIGNGTASRETEAFIADLIKDLKTPVYYVIVSEAGASVYSASDLARDEFPDFHVEERSAISIGRRMQDPLSELVKIDPKSIGVGQYQHDVSQSKLADSLDFVVSTAVNQVGVDVNTASASLLQYVSGLSMGVATNVVKYRETVGPFKTRNDLLNVSKLGPKIYEQAVGFLRIPDSVNPLDRTPIHPESYELTEKILKHINVGLADIGTPICKLKAGMVDRIDLAKKLGVSLVTVQDLLDAIVSPQRDPRENYPQPLLKSELLRLEDLRVGMELQGTVRNVVDFGAFIDCGIHEAGLVHISKMSKQYIKHPLEAVSVGDIVKVWVLSVDLTRKRLQLTMLNQEEQAKRGL